MSTKLFFGPTALDSLEVEKCRDGAGGLQELIPNPLPNTIEGDLTMLNQMVDCNPAVMTWHHRYVSEFRTLNVEELFDKLGEEWAHGGDYVGAHSLQFSIPGTSYSTVAVVPKEHSFAPLCWVERLGFLERLGIVAIPTTARIGVKLGLTDSIPLDDIVTLTEEVSPQDD